MLSRDSNPCGKLKVIAWRKSRLIAHSPDDREPKTAHGGKPLINLSSQLTDGQ